ncbi:PP2C family protein-serine/threonine phosphatase [Streptomyces minutiscleroticus]|uniref:PP2C family protein-serine/threonine phosphatase n=1 Tax=Streptomyces minutiscleroticus TaxID=68238 RepID=UPI00167DF034|nr:PP2C family protein-serine/threonine phosphatase [Streptomyces minutiscleroticus]
MCAEYGRLAALTDGACVEPAVRVRCADGAGPGGDLHDAVLTPSGPRLILGDVKGHGEQAAPLAAALRTAFRDAAPTEADPVRLAHTLDTRIGPRLGPEDFVTVLLADFRLDEIRLVNCGHPPPLRTGRRLAPVTAPSPSPPLGLAPDPRMQRTRLHPDQRLLLYTDGLVEARDGDGVFFPLDRHVHAALNAPTLDQALDRLLDLLLRHTGRTTTADDLTLILLQRAPVPLPRHPCPRSASPFREADP